VKGIDHKAPSYVVFSTHYEFHTRHISMQNSCTCMLDQMKRVITLSSKGFN